MGLTAAIVPVLRSADAKRDFALSQQINSAAVSVMANIAEGHERQGRREFGQFLRVALASNAEVRACLYAAFDRGYVDQVTFAELRARTQELSRMLQALRNEVVKQVERRPK